MPSNAMEASAIFCLTKHATAISNYGEKWKHCFITTPAHVVASKLRSILEFMILGSRWLVRSYPTIESLTQSAAAEWGWFTERRTSNLGGKSRLSSFQKIPRQIPQR